MFKLNKLGLLKKVIDGRAPEYPVITRWDSLQFEQKHYTAYRSPQPKQWGEYSSTLPLKKNALNLEPTTSFSLMKTTLTNNASSNYTVDNFKVDKKTPEDVYVGCVGLRQNYLYVEWQWKVE